MKMDLTQQEINTVKRALLDQVSHIVGPMGPFEYPVANTEAPWCCYNDNIRALISKFSN